MATTTQVQRTESLPMETPFLYNQPIEFGDSDAPRKTTSTISRASTVSDTISEKTGFHSIVDIVAKEAYIAKDHIKARKVVGEGAFAEVYTAELSNRKSIELERSQSPSLVAVKQLKSTCNADEIADFVQEAAVLQTLRHGNIIEFLGLGAMDTSSDDSQWNSLYMVQEFAECGTLKALLMKQMVNYNKAAYHFVDALRWVQNIAEALAYMHERTPEQVIHRDLKCDNILLLKNTDGIIVAKIGDFGLHARVPKSPVAVCDNSKGMAYALTGKTGSYVYMAPEVLLGKPYNASVDVYSWGVICFELFTKSLIGTKFMNTTDWDESEAYACKVAAGYRPDIPEYVPESLRVLITKCWATDGDLRPSMTEVIETLKEIEASGVVDSMSVSKSKKKPAPSAAKKAAAQAGQANKASGGCCVVM